MYRTLHESTRKDFSPDGAAWAKPADPYIDRSEDAIMALNLVPFAEEFQRWIWESPAAEIVGELMDSAYVQYWLDAIFLKEGSAENAATPWHNDICSWPLWGDKLAILWIALTDVGPDDAPLLTLLGTHRGHTRFHSPIYDDRADIPDGYRPWSELLAKVDDPQVEQRAWTVKKGDAVVVHPGVTHCSLPRRARGSGRRLAFSTRWIGDDVVFQPDSMSDRLVRFYPDMVQGKKPGEDVLPVIWRRGEGLRPRV